MKHIAKLLVFAMLLSLLCIGGTALAANDCVGDWEYDDYSLWFHIDSDDSWQEYNINGFILDGYYEETGSGLELYLLDGTLWVSMELDGTVMTDSDGDTLFASDIPDFETTELEELDAAGVWEVLSGDPCWVLIYPGYEYIIYDDEEALLNGYVRISGDEILLLENYDDDDSDAFITLTFDDDGNLLADTDETLVHGYVPFDHSTTLSWISFDDIFTPAGSVSDLPSEYIGVWEYDDYYLWIELDSDGTWATYANSGLIEDGTWDGSDDEASLYLSDGSLYYTLTLDGDVMTEDGEYTMFASELPDFETSELEELGADGIWECRDDTGWLVIYPGGMWFIYDEDGVTGNGWIHIADDNTILLLENNDDDDEDSLLELTVNADGTLTDSADEDFVRSELPDF